MSVSLKALTLSIGILFWASPFVEARQSWPDSPLSNESQIELEKASKYMKSRPEKATPMILNTLNSANDIPKCLAIAAYTEAYGHPMLEVRRACVTKALSLCQTRDDFLNVAIKARKYECFEVTRQSVNNLITSTKNLEELYDLARKTQEVALNDISHLAMEKAYREVDSVEDALKFAREAKSMGMEDLCRKTVKDLIDDESNAHELCMLLKSVEPLDIKDLNRYLLKKAIDCSRSTSDFHDVWEAARRHGYNDIFKLAEFRGRRAQIMDRNRATQADIQRRMGQQQQPQGLPTGF